MSQILHHLFIDSPIAKHNLICVHGLLGSSNNFRSILRNKKINDQVASYCVDMRNHGKSFHSSTMTSYELGEDLYKFVKANNLQNLIFLGHSLGGVAVSSMASSFPELWEITKGIVLIDISPENPHLTRKSNIIRSTMEKLSFYHPVGKPYIQIKKDIIDLCDHDMDVAGLVMTNIKGNEKLGYSWSSNIYTLSSEYHNYINGHHKYICPLKMKLIYGKESRYIHNSVATPEMFNKYFSNFDMEKDIVGIKDAGHWVHAQKPYEFIDTLSTMITDLINN